MASILVIEDNSDVRALLLRALRDAGHEVEAAATGRDGLARFRAAEFDLVITDIVMPEVDGTECIAAMRKRDPDALILAISGGGTHLEKECCLDLALRLGARAVLSKPFRVQALEDTVADLLAAA